MEFQPSGLQAGQSYLNVGEQHLWVQRDHYVFESPERAIQGAVDLGSPGQRSARLEHLMSAAADAARRRFQTHGEGRSALQRLATLENDALTAGIALAVLGDGEGAQARLTADGIHQAYRDVADRYLNSLASTTVDHVADAEIAAARTTLRLPPNDLSIGAVRSS